MQKTTTIGVNQPSLTNDKNRKTGPSENFRVIGAILILVGAMTIGVIGYKNSQKREQSIVFSPKFMLSALWDAYKRNYWESSTGRTLDRQRNDITTSEGQSYTMLRAVWQDDKDVFDKTWQWTKTNLKRPNDNLFSWLYGKRPDGSYGVIASQGGQNSATDGDTDIALSLLFASVRWQDASHLTEAKQVIQDIWNNEVVTINGTPYITADNVEKNSSTLVLINPSYLAPYAYRIFAVIDPAHDWNKVVDSSYEILDKAVSSPLDKKSSSNLPPDWVVINRKTGQITPANTNSLTSDYGYDAMRVPFRLAMDWQWNREQRAKQILSKFDFLNRQWADKGAIYATYSHDGQVVSNIESPAVYGGSLGYFLVENPDTAKAIYQNKLENLYSPDFQAWKKILSYYDDNWAWFALALYNNSLPNLFPQNLPNSVKPASTSGS